MNFKGKRQIVFKFFFKFFFIWNLSWELVILLGNAAGKKLSGFAIMIASVYSESLFSDADSNPGNNKIGDTDQCHSFLCVLLKK